jgi:hypothetical protein
MIGFRRRLRYWSIFAVGTCLHLPTGELHVKAGRGLPLELPRIGARPPCIHEQDYCKEKNVEINGMRDNRYRLFSSELIQTGQFLLPRAGGEIGSIRG